MSASARLIDQTLEEAFPKINAGVKPFGERVVVQIMSPPTKTKSGLVLTDYTRQTANDTCQVAKVVAVGPLAFKHRTSGNYWVEGAWYGEGTIVRVPKYIGDRWKVKVDNDLSVEFAIFKDLDILGEVDDPLSMRSHI